MKLWVTYRRYLALWLASWVTDEPRSTRVFYERARMCDLYLQDPMLAFDYVMQLEGKPNAKITEVRPIK